MRVKQAGIVSLIVTFLMMIVISLLVLGFSEATRRNSRETLDRQLSTQAYYAAESAINDAVKAIQTPSFSLAASYSSNCTGPNSFINQVLGRGTGPVTLSSTDNVAYTCLLVASETATLPEGDLDTGVSKADHFILSNSGTALTFSWGSNDGVSGPSTCPGSIGAFTAANVFTGRCPFAVLRVDIVPANTGADAASLAAATHTFYLEPTSVTSNGAGNLATNGKVVGANCDSTPKCTATLNNVSVLNSREFYVRLSTIYNSARNISIGSNNNASFSGSSIQIDATGKAQDELRRIRVSLPINAHGVVPTNAVSAPNGVCKRFTIIGSGNQAVPNYNDATSPLCYGTSLPPINPSQTNPGDAAYESDNSINPNGPPVGPTPGPYYARYFKNTSTNPPSNVAGCTWNWGDGTQSHSACNSGDILLHTFPTNRNDTCRGYEVTLTINLNSGGNRTYSKHTWVPAGDNFPSC